MFLSVNLLNINSAKISCCSLDYFLPTSADSGSKSALPTTRRYLKVILRVPVSGFGKATSFRAARKANVGVPEAINGLISVFQVPVYQKIQFKQLHCTNLTVKHSIYFKIIFYVFQEKSYYALFRTIVHNAIVFLSED